MSKEPPRITFEEVMRTLDQYRTQCYTKEQDQLIVEARSKEPPVEYGKLAELWAKLGWGQTNPDRLRKRWLRLKFHQ